VRNRRVYLDQNIIVYIRDGSIDLSTVKGVDWIYSDEHFREIARTDERTSRSLLSVLEQLKAQLLEVNVTERFYSDKAFKFNEYSCPHKLFDLHRDNTVEAEKMADDVTTVMVRQCGGDNYEEVSGLPEKMEGDILDLFSSAEALDEARINAVQETSKDFKDSIESRLSKTVSLESQRKEVGLGKGKAGNIEGVNVIEEIWGLIEGYYKGYSCDQILGLKKRGVPEQEAEFVCVDIVGGYMVLNAFGYRPDKNIHKFSGMRAAQSDASHVMHAAFCDGLVSVDRSLRLKAEAIFIYTGIKTKIFRGESEVRRWLSPSASEVIL
jgi:hypothetical protein